MSSQEAQNANQTKPLLSTPGCVKVAAPVVAVAGVLVATGNQTFAALAVGAVVVAAFAAGGLKLAFAARK